MLTIKWTDDCELGVEAIDNQHKHLIELMNQLALAIDKRKRAEDVGEDLVAIADELGRYMDEHFNDEEVLYRENGIDTTEHEKLHKDFIFRLRQSRDALIKGTDLRELLEVYRELLSWFMDHIKIEDKDLWASI